MQYLGNWYLGDKMTKRYLVDFYDMFDGWCHSAEFWHRDFDSFEEAKIVCDKLMEELDESNKRCGEHYGVIDSTVNREIYCTRKNDW